MNAFTLLIAISLLLGVCSLIWQSYPLTSVAIILICAALLATGMGWLTIPPK